MTEKKPKRPPLSIAPDTVPDGDAKPADSIEVRIVEAGEVTEDDVIKALAPLVLDIVRKRNAARKND
jgi:hypothetical protein